MINSEYGFSKSVGSSIVDYSKYDVRVYDYIKFRTNYNKFYLMEREVWGSNSDPDFIDIPLWRAYTIENNIFTLGYILLSKRYFKNGELNNEIKINPVVDYINEDIKVAIDIEDFVIFNMRRAVPYIKKAMTMMMNAITELNPDFIVINPNNYSKPFVKRLKSLGFEIKYYNYPKYIGSISFDESNQGVQGPKGEDGKNLELRSLNTCIQWRLEGSDEWINLIDISDLIKYDINAESLLESQKSYDLENDPSTYLLTVSQGQILKRSIDSLYEYISNLGLDTDVDLTPIPGPKGEDARNPEFRVFEEKLQWKLEGDEYWVTLFKIPSYNENNSISINDTLFSEDSNSALSANQGRVLNEKIANIIQILSSIDGSNNSSNFSIQLRNNNGILQWVSSDMEKWEDLIDLSNINNNIYNIEIEDNLFSEDISSALSANQGRVLNDKIINILKYLSYIGLDPSGKISGVQGPKGKDGKNIELRRNYTHIQWRNVGEFEWNDLIAISDLSNDCTLELEEYVTKDFLHSKIIDDLNSDLFDSALSARQGVILKRYIDSIHELIKNSNPSGSNTINIEIVDDLSTGGKEKALSANQGKILDSKLGEVSNKLESLIKLNNRLLKSSFEPGFIFNGEIIVSINQWTSIHYEPVTPGKVYTFKGDKFCNILRWSYYGIKDGKITHLSDEFINDKEYVLIRIPQGVNFIKLGFLTTNADSTFTNYEFFES